MSDLDGTNVTRQVPSTKIPKIFFLPLWRHGGMTNFQKNSGQYFFGNVWITFSIFTVDTYFLYVRKDHFAHKNFSRHFEPKKWHIWVQSDGKKIETKIENSAPKIVSEKVFSNIQKNFLGVYVKNWKIYNNISKKILTIFFLKIGNSPMTS